MEPLLPKQGRGPKRKDDRKVLNGIFYILRTGAPGIAKIMTEAVEVQFFCFTPAFIKKPALNHLENGSPGYPVTPIVSSGNNLSVLVSLTVLT